MFYFKMVQTALAVHAEEGTGHIPEMPFSNSRMTALSTQRIMFAYKSDQLESTFRPIF